MIVQYDTIYTIGIHIWDKYINSFFWDMMILRFDVLDISPKTRDFDEKIYGDYPNGMTSKNTRIC